MLCYDMVEGADVLMLIQRQTHIYNHSYTTLCRDIDSQCIMRTLTANSQTCGERALSNTEPPTAAGTSQKPTAAAKPDTVEAQVSDATKGV